jgi:hypothetical protein
MNRMGMRFAIIATSLGALALAQMDVAHAAGGGKSGGQPKENKTQTVQTKKKVTSPKVQGTITHRKAGGGQQEY